MQDGVHIERGIIQSVGDSGYIVRSITRDGIETNTLKAKDGESYNAGDCVYFFVFPDGNGMVLGRAGE